MDAMSKLEQVFLTFTDASIEGYTGNKVLLEIKMSCMYLTDTIEIDFKMYYLVLKDVGEFEFTAWMNTLDLEQRLFTEMEYVLNAGLEIANVRLKEDYIEITCNQDNEGYNYCGGVIKLNCNTIEVYDENRNLLELEELQEISKKYWNKFGVKNTD